MDEKKELRKHFSSLRKELRSEQKDDFITAKILALDCISKADTILLYASFGSEINTWKLAEQLLMKEKTIAFPRCGKDSTMTFHIISELSQLRNGVPGKYGICEPDASLPQPAVTDRTVCIVPGLAFTSEGGRLGYGGGYYDRYLAANNSIQKIALAYEGMLTDELPLLPHDLKVDSIVTEERTVLCNG